MTASQKKKKKEIKKHNKLHSKLLRRQQMAEKTNILIAPTLNQNYNFTLAHSYK